MLTPKQLLAETAKFFKIHPDRWMKGDLVRGGASSPVNADETCRFCTVGYMAYRLAKEDPTLRSAVRDDPYRAVGQFFGSRYGTGASRLYEVNDGRGLDSTVDFLINEAACA